MEEKLSIIRIGLQKQDDAHVLTKVKRVLSSMLLYLESIELLDAHNKTTYLHGLTVRNCEPQILFVLFFQLKVYSVVVE